jgi:cellulose synthase/poly-beta-1,6-N-acetylglucosamine synthase-like glycosyltransferase
MTSAQQPPRTVVLVPTINNQKDLQRCLAALKAQTYAPFRIVVVDGNSTDATPALTRAAGAELMLDGSSTRGDALNAALKALDCDLVVFTDDDCYPPPDWLARLLVSFERPEVAAVGGPNVAPPDQGFWGRVVDVVLASPVFAETRYGKTGGGALEEVAHNSGCNAAYRKSVLDQVGGFPVDSRGAEDVLLDLKIRQAGHRLWYQPGAVTYHRRRDTLKSFSRQMRSYGRGKAHANWSNPELFRLSHWAPSVALVGLIVALAALPVTAVLWPSLFLWGGALVAGGLGLGVLGSMLAAARSSSWCRSLSTVLVSPLVMLVLLVSVGRGYLSGAREMRVGRLTEDKGVGNGQGVRGR